MKSLGMALGAVMTAMLVSGACVGDSDVELGSSNSGGSTGQAGNGDAAGPDGGSAGATSDGGGGSGVGGSGGDGGSGADCEPGCGVGLECCDGKCVNQNNDILNCGGCGTECTVGNPFCDNGTCGTAPCDLRGSVCAGNQFCCGTECCALDELCCVVPSSVVSPAACTKPVEGTCPTGTPGSVCAHPDTPIATPDGDRPIASLRHGDLIYSVNGDAVVVVPILRTTRTLVVDHEVMRIELDNGRELRISAGHPTADGRLLGDLQPGDMLLDVRITSVERVPYDAPATYDILPASDSGAYFAGGALIGSTITQP